MLYKEFTESLRNRKDNEFIRATNVLGEMTIYYIGIAIQNFRCKKSTYKEMIQNIEDLGFNIEIVYRNSDSLTEETLEKFLERKNKEELVPSDIHALLLSNNEYSNLLVYYDDSIKHVLAQHGNALAKEQLQTSRTLYSRDNSSNYIRSRKR